MKNTPHIIKNIEAFNKIAWNKIYSCLTWLRPSGRLHLGHYKWALENWLLLQSNPNIKCNFLIADYQVLWDHLWDTDRLRSSVVDMVIDWLSIGLDPDKSNFVVQSYVPEFAELFNFLTMFVPYTVATNNPTLRHEIKNLKSGKTWNSTNVSLGFINYPVSEAADILLPLWEIIPVWEDQVPHIEVTRKIIDRVNKMYWLNFPLPRALLSDSPRLVWTDGKDKMSKSLWNTIYLTSSLSEIKEKVHSMYTDPGKVNIESPWDISKHVVFLYLDVFYKDKEHIVDLKSRYQAWWPNSVGDWELKKLLVKTLEEFIAPIREKRAFYENNRKLIVNSIRKWSDAMRGIWSSTIFTLKNAMWLLKYWEL